MCLEEARLTTGNILDGDYCSGYECPRYSTCVGNKEFENLEKHTPTDYEIEEAIRRERHGRK